MITCPDAWQAKYDRLVKDGWYEGFSLPKRFAVASVVVIDADKAAYMVTTDGRVVLYKFQSDIGLRMFWNITPTEEEIAE